jgi:hypothetical protein
MECQIKNQLEQHLSDIRILAARKGLTAEEKDAAICAERFAIQLLREHDATGHGGKRCPFATQVEEWPDFLSRFRTDRRTFSVTIFSPLGDAVLVVRIRLRCGPVPAQCLSGLALL